MVSRSREVGDLLPGAATETPDSNSFECVRNNPEFLRHVLDAGFTRTISCYILRCTAE